MHHPAVRYETKEGLPGEYFRCERLRGSLSAVSCAQRWRAARDPKNEVYGMCRGCPIGAAHAGQVCDNPEQGRKVCVRCDQPTTRLIHGLYCPSCINRQYEVEKGRNGKGAPPHPVERFFLVDATEVVSKVVAIHPVSLRIADGGRIRLLSGLRVADMQEAAKTVIRRSPQRVQFFPRPVAFPRQRDLFVLD
jgi:hypothetical protein